MKIKPLLALLGMLWSVDAAAQTVRGIGIPIRVTDDAMEAFISQQWAKRGWGSFSGTILGCNYRIVSPPPGVNLTPGQGSLTFRLTLTSDNCGGSFSPVLKPRFAIPDGQLPSATIRMTILDLYDWIENLDFIDGLPVPAWVRAALKRELGERWSLPDLRDGIETFPSTLVACFSNPFLDQRSLNLHLADPVGLAWRVEEGALVLVPSVNLQSGIGATVTPDFRARLFLASNTDWLDIWSNIRAKVRTARVYNVAGNLLYRLDPGVYSVKYRDNPFAEWIMIDLKGTRLGYQQVYFVWALFEIDHTFYLRKYTVATSSTGWTLASSEGYN